jgi:hypothetical protein
MTSVSSDGVISSDNAGRSDPIHNECFAIPCSRSRSPREDEVDPFRHTGDEGQAGGYVSALP